MDQCSFRNDIRIQGEQGKASFDFGTAKIEGKRPFVYDGPSVNPAIQEYADLIQAIRTNEPVNDGVQVAESTMTAIMGRICAYTGSAVKWNWLMNASKLDLSPAKPDIWRSA